MTISTEKYMQAMLKSFKPEKAGGLNVNFLLALSGKKGGNWAIVVANRQCKISSGTPSRVDTAIKMSTSSYLKLAEGNLNVRSAYQKGEVKVDGNIQYALKFSELFSPWASFVQAEQPASPEPAQPDSLPSPVESVPASPVSSNEPTIADYVRAMPNGFRSGNAGDLKATYQFQIAGGGTWTVSVANQAVTVAKGVTVSPNVTIEISTSDFIKLAQGKLNTTQAYQRGQIKVDGNVNLAAKITDIFAAWANTVGVTPQQSAPQPQPVSPQPVSQPESVPSAPSQAPSSPAGPIFSHLMNGSFDEYQPYVRDGEAKSWKEDSFPERYGKDWTLKVISERKRRIHLMDSGVFGKFTQRYFGGGGRDYHIHGRHSQVITGRYGFDVLFYQSVAAQPGQTVTFGGSIVSFYKGTAGERADGKIFKTIGIDPTGGRDWRSSTVVWGERDGKDNEWRYPSLKVAAKANAITVFIRIENTEKDVGSTELNIIHLENFKLG